MADVENPAAPATDDITAAVLDHFKPKRPQAPPVKSAAQLLLERQLAARTRLAAAAVALEQALANIRGGEGPAAGRGVQAAPESQGQFFGALEALTADFEALADDIEAGARELLDRF